MTQWKSSQEKQAKRIRDLKSCTDEFDTTLGELAERTDMITAMRAVALTIAVRAHMTPNPQKAIEEFKEAVDSCFQAVCEDSGEYK